MKPDFDKAFLKFLKVLNLDRSDILSIYWISAFSGIIFLALPLGIQTIVSFVMAGSISTSIIVLIVFVVISVFLNGYLQIKQLDIIERIEQKIFVRYAFAYSEKLPKIDLQKTDQYYLPELVNRFFDVSTLQKGIFKLLLEVPPAILQIVIGTVLLSFYHPIFIGFGVFLLILVAIIIRYTSYMGFDSSIETSNQKYMIGDWLEQISRNVKMFKYNNDEEFHMDKTNDLVSNYLTGKIKHYRILRVQYWSLIGFKVLIFMGMLVLGISLLVEQEINIGQFIAADIIILGIISAVEKFIQNFDKIYECLTAIEKLDKIVLAPQESNGNIIYANQDKGISVVFDDVSFSYNNVNKVFTNLSFSVQSGEWLQIKGDKKSGKSSILNLISGSYQDYNGYILINDLPIGNYDLTSLRKHIGYYKDNAFLVEGSILDNICLSNSEINHEQVIQLAKMTGLWKHLISAKEGLNLKVNPYVRNLPSSFVNSILLTRALYQKPDLLLLENPFYHMSSEEIGLLINYLKSDIYCPTAIVVDNENEKNIVYNHSITI